MGFKEETDVKPIERDPLTLTGMMALFALFMLVLSYVLYKAFGGWIGVSLDFGWAWDSQGSMTDGLLKVWPFFAWGGAVTLLTGIIAVIRRTPREYPPGYIFTRGTWLSLNAGLFDGIIYRWLAIFSAMFFIKLLNAITFGLLKWFYVEVTIPVSNWITFGILEPQLYGPHGWLFAAAILSACFYYQEEHKYLGYFGWVNSWFAAIVLFYLVFNYGLWTAIVAHIIYDLCVFWTRAFMARYQPRDPFAHLLAALFGSPRR